MKVEKQQLEIFRGKHVQLIKKEGFVLDGIIDKIYEDCLLFTTKQKTALISFDVIEEIRCVHTGRRSFGY